MNTIDILSMDLETNATNLKNALETYGASYFDDYETDFTNEGGEKIVKCMVGNTAAVEFVLKSQNGWMHIRYNGTDISQGTYRTNVVYANRLHVCEKAIIFDMYPNPGGYGLPTLVLCKTTNGNTAIVFLAGNGNGDTINAYIDRNNVQNLAVLSVDRSTGACVLGILGIKLSSNSSAKASGFTPFSGADGTIVDGVYVMTNTDYADRTDPFNFSIGNQIYTGCFKNVFAVKGT